MPVLRASSNSRRGDASIPASAEAGPPGAADSDERPLRWFAIWTRSRHERAVYDQLTERGIEAFLPTVASWSRWKDRKKKIDRPLFPGY